MAPEHLPDRLHWFKWEAYTTWLSGAALLVLIYYMESGYLVPATGASVGRAAGAVIGVAVIVGGWVAYDLLCRSPLSRRPAILSVVLLGLVMVITHGLLQALSPRAAFIHVGAMLGTWMAANVFFVIIPGQRAMVRAMEAGETPDPDRGRRGALRSLHNNYLTLPVLFLMVSVHYPVSYAGPRAWLVILAVLAVGPVVRHYYNLRHRGRYVAWLLPVALAVLAIAALVATPARERGISADSTASSGNAPRVTDGIAEAILDVRCVPCHSSRPTHPSATVAPFGVLLDEPAQARSLAGRVAVTVQSETMPLGNVTGMTPEERALLLRWLHQSP